MNWKQELAAEIMPLEEINANPAILTLRVDVSGSSDWASGGKTTANIVRQMSVKAPEIVNRQLVDGDNIRLNDRYTELSFVALKAAFTALPGDPYLPHALSTLRPFTPADAWGLRLGVDTLTINGEAWTITRIEERGYLGAEPSYFRLYLRR